MDARRGVATAALVLGLLCCGTAAAADPGNSVAPTTNTKALNDKVLNAFKLLAVRESAPAGVDLLEEAANEGSDDAKYFLGWYYVQGMFAKPDYDKALQYLEQVSGELRNAATILMGVAYAEGSKTRAPDMEKTERIFKDVASKLDAQFEARQRMPQPADAEAMVSDMTKMRRW